MVLLKVLYLQSNVKLRRNLRIYRLLQKYVTVLWR